MKFLGCFCISILILIQSAFAIQPPQECRPLVAQNSATQPSQNQNRKWYYTHPADAGPGPLIEGPTTRIPPRIAKSVTKEEALDAKMEAVESPVRDLLINGHIDNGFRPESNAQMRRREYTLLRNALPTKYRKDTISREIFPVEILGRATEKPFESGFRTEDLGYYRAMTVTTRKLNFDYYSRSYDHTFGRGKPENFDQVLPLFKGSKNPFLEAELSIVREGRTRQLNYLKRLLLFTFPEYGRRDWHIDPITGQALPLDEASLDRMISDVFRNLEHYLSLEKKGERLPLLVGWTIKALQSLPQTPYHEIFRVNADGTEETVALVGVTRASYGFVRLFNLKTQQWEDHYGPFGSKFQEQYFTNPNDPFAPPAYVTGDHPEIPMFDKITKQPRHGSFVDAPLWDRPVPMLPMEVFLKDHDVKLPRPGIPNALYNWYADRYDGTGKMFLNGPFPEGIDPDTSKPMVYFTGQILEPTKFAISKNFDQRENSYSELHSMLMDTIFDWTRQQDYDQSNFNLNGQYLYTYNPGTVDPDTKKVKGEVSLYLRMGWHAVPGLPSYEVNGSSWVAIGISPENLMKLGNKISNADAKRFLDSLERFTQRNFWLTDKPEEP